ncbi:mitochondrial uncoupling protein 3-like [Nicotiana tabacum]|uniref:Mitochondrial uncoupling protein 3-like n=1 Tax=Nicotiana tabacum TaxID=4097 RepID=A0AC58U1W8_TOBAC
MPSVGPVENPIVEEQDEVRVADPALVDFTSAPGFQDVMGCMLWFMDNMTHAAFCMLGRIFQFPSAAFIVEHVIVVCLLVIQVVASPADLVKVRMQAESRMASQGMEPRYCGPFDAFNKIIRTEGFLGLWKGVLPNVQRAFLVNMGDKVLDKFKFVINNNIANDNIYAHTLSSIMSGLSATTLSCPADVIKTRMMNQAADKQGKNKYRNSYDCLVKTVGIEGVKALWKGFFPTWARLGPWQFVFWVSYEKFRQIAGLSSF